MDLSGRATAEEINSLRTGKGRSWRIGGLSFPRSLTMVGLVFALAPASARAAAGGVPAEIAALQTQVAELQSIVHTLQDQVSALQASNTALHRELAAVQSNKALLLGPFVNVDPNPENGVIGPNIKFTGANIHILSGSGSTNDRTNFGAPSKGLGNVIIGYDEPPGGLSATDRGGSHNLVIGVGHRFTTAAFGGIVAGADNTIDNLWACVPGGSFNTASGFSASATGGENNTASGFFASVTGGRDNTASGFFASVTGGVNNTAGGKESVVLGGTNVINNKNNSIAPQPPFP
jgi:hypothetical protein